MTHLMRYLHASIYRYDQAGDVVSLCRLGVQQVSVHEVQVYTRIYTTQVYSRRQAMMDCDIKRC